MRDSENLILGAGLLLRRMNELHMRVPKDEHERRQIRLELEVIRAKWSRVMEAIRRTDPRSPQE